MFNLTIDKKIMSQITNNILMIKPVSFRYNDQTAVNNYYQKKLMNYTFSQLQNKALLEFNTFVKKLENCGVNVIVIEDTMQHETPDSIFPNNWVSFHKNGQVGLYPMYADNRRMERREDIFGYLVEEHDFHIKEIKDYTDFEKHNKYLEGTGSLVLDREHKICYAATSIRTDKDVVKKFCKDFGYRSVFFTANQDVNGERRPIYHTNVMMCIADNFAVICLESIDDKEERKYVIESLISSGKEIIEITEDQKNKFAGNMLQVMGDQPYLVMSSSAFISLTKKQKIIIENFCSIIHSPLNIIETCGGGSARCMIAEVFLPKSKI